MTKILLGVLWWIKQNSTPITEKYIHQINIQETLCAKKENTLIIIILLLKILTVALERIWSIKKNLPVGGVKPGLLNRNSLLPQAKYYSRHGGLRSKNLMPLSSTDTPEGILQFCLKVAVKTQTPLDCFHLSDFLFNYIMSLWKSNN